MSSLQKLLKLGLLTAALAIISVGFGGRAHADSYSGSNLIDDNIFVNAGTMSQTDIQNFLNSQGGSLASQTFSTPSNGNQSAAWIIYYVSQHIGINPRVIMATMQKEESLITDPSASSTQYNYAMGYGCPDSGSCSDPGFWNQTIDGSWQLRFDYERAGGNTSYWTSPDGTQWGNPSISYPCSGASSFYSTGLYSGNSVTFYDGGGSAYTTITLANRSTAALYCYTPHVYPGDANYYYSGSYNFVQSFISWWGNVHDIWTWSFVSQSSTANLNNIYPGQSFQVTVTAKNTGTTTWVNTGTNRLSIATSNPQGRTSSFYDSSWLSPTTPANLTEASVAPGATGTFTFTMKAPSTLGAYNEYFNLVAQNITWLNDLGQYFHINVVTPYSWSFNSQAAYTDSSKATAVNLSSMSPGQTAWLVVKANNIGNATWSKTGTNQVDLATDRSVGRSSRFATNAWLSPNTPAQMDEASVAPGGVATFEFPIQIPVGAGTYNEYFNPVAQGITYFNNNPGQYFGITVNGTYKWAFAMQAAYPSQTDRSTTVNLSSLSPGQTAWLVVKAYNIGSTTWYQGGNYPFELATDRSVGRSSRFATNAWLSPSTPAKMNEASVAPGQTAVTATFEFPIQVPPGGGTFNEYFNPVAQNITYLNDDPGQYFGMTVGSTYAWSITSQAAYTDSSASTPLDLSNMTAGQTGWLVVKAKNTGNTTWYNSGSYRLSIGTSNPNSRTSRFATNAWLSPNTPANLTESSVAPGATGTFQFPITVPSGTGTFTEYFNLLAQNIMWLNDPGLHFTVTVH